VVRPLLLDDMFPHPMAEQLCAKGHDVRAVVSTPTFAGLPDEEILIGAAEAGRALVTANIKDFMPIDARYRALGRGHAGLIMVAAKTFPQNRTYIAAVTSALNALLASTPGAIVGRVVFLQRV
jgi:nucleoside-diphosphate-sugar epimerase